MEIFCSFYLVSFLTLIEQRRLKSLILKNLGWSGSLSQAKLFARATSPSRRRWHAEEDNDRLSPAGLAGRGLGGAVVNLAVVFICEMTLMDLIFSCFKESTVREEATFRSPWWM